MTHEQRKARQRAYQRKYREASPARRERDRLYRQARHRAKPEESRAQTLRRRHGRRSLLNEWKAVPCQDCGHRYPPYVMDFDHVRGEKRFNIGSNLLTPTIDELLDELAKCDVVCSNCHRERTHQRRATCVEPRTPIEADELSPTANNAVRSS